MYCWTLYKLQIFPLLFPVIFIVFAVPPYCLLYFSLVLHFLLSFIHSSVYCKTFSLYFIHSLSAPLSFTTESSYTFLLASNFPFLIQYMANPLQGFLHYTLQNIHCNISLFIEKVRGGKRFMVAVLDFQ